MDHHLSPHKLTPHQTSAPPAYSSCSQTNPVSERRYSSSQSDYSASECRSQTPPTMLEVLGEHLYSKVQWLQEHGDVELDVAKVTGILLELGEKQIFQLLQDETLLKARLQQIIQHVPEVCIGARGKYYLPSSIHSNDDPNIANEEPQADSEDEEQLHDLVWQLEPELSSQLTGMVLELGSVEVKALLQSPRMLSQAVSRAKSVFCQQNQTSKFSADMHTPENAVICTSANAVTRAPTKSTTENDHRQSNADVPCVQTVKNGIKRGQKPDESMVDNHRQRCVQGIGGNSALEEEEEEVGELVYAEALKLYPESAAKITGMLLEMGESRIKALLHDKAQLHIAFKIACSSLPSASGQQLLGE